MKIEIAWQLEITVNIRKNIQLVIDKEQTNLKLLSRHFSKKEPSLQDLYRTLR